MLYLEDIKDWLKTIYNADFYYMGKLDSKKDKSIGIYQRKTSMKKRICIGGLKNTSYEIKPISILIHWNCDASLTERAAFELYKALQECVNTEIIINNIHIQFIDLLSNEPIFVGNDEKGVYEYVIELDIYYDKRKD